jgi:hypothetical protein
MKTEASLHYLAYREARFNNVTCLQDKAPIHPFASATE